MTRTRKQRRAETVKQLKHIDLNLWGKRGLFNALGNLRHKKYRHGQEQYVADLRDFLIDILSEDECAIDSDRACSACGAHIGRDAVMYQVDMGGNTYKIASGEVKFCPVCGARVTMQTEEGDEHGKHSCVCSGSRDGRCGDADSGDMREGLSEEGDGHGHVSDGCAVRERCDGDSDAAAETVSDTHQSELINCGKPYYDGRAVLDAGVIRSCGHDTREKLEADVREHITYTTSTLLHPASANKTTEMLGTLPVDTVLDWLNRQAAITENEWYDEVYQLEKKCDELDRESDQFEMQYKEQSSRCEELRKERDHMRKACADMVEEMWHAYGTAQFVNRKLWESEDAKTARIELLESTLEDTVRERDELREGNEILAKSEVIELPKDADGEYVHVGDVMVYADGNTCPMPAMAIVSSVVFLVEDGPRYADMCRHWHPRGKDGKPIVRGDVVYGEDGVGYNVSGIVKDKPHCVVGEREDGTCKWMRPEWLTHEKPVTVADVLREFALACEESGYRDPSIGGLLDKYAAKLRLAGDGE